MQYYFPFTPISQLTRKSILDKTMQHKIQISRNVLMTQLTQNSLKTGTSAKIRTSGILGNGNHVIWGLGIHCVEQNAMKYNQGSNKNCPRRQPTTILLIVVPDGKTFSDPGLSTTGQCVTKTRFWYWEPKPKSNFCISIGEIFL